MIRNHESRLLSTVPCGTGVATFRFERPEGYEYRAGQWLRLTLQTATGPETKTFTHSSAPGDPELEITTRLSGSPFKQALAGLAEGDAVTIAGPGGRLALPEGASRVVFLVGGVGVTPARSLLRDAAQRGRRFDDALVIFGNRDESCAPYLDELSSLGDIGVRVVPVYESAGPEWAGERGLVTAEMVRRHVDPADGRPFVVAGPPVMVEAMEAVLDELGIDDTRRIIERFGASGGS